MANVSSISPEAPAPEIKNEKNRLEIVYDDQTSALLDPEPPEIKKHENNLEIICEDKTAFFEKNKLAMEEVNRENNEKGREEKKKDLIQTENVVVPGEWKEGQLLKEYVFSEFIVGPSNGLPTPRRWPWRKVPGASIIHFLFMAGWDWVKRTLCTRSGM